MNIVKGIQKTSLVDYPPYIATTLFLGGCNMRCGYCHNKDLVLSFGSMEGYSFDYVFELFEKRKKWIDAVCISGGEPTLYKELPALVKRIKDCGLLVKLDTNGTNPKMLKELLGMLDFVSMDIKNSFERYKDVTGVDNSNGVKESVKILIESGVDYEFRMTVHPKYHSRGDFVKVGKWLEGAKRFSIQQFDAKSVLIDESLASMDKFSEAELLTFMNVLKKYIKTVEIKNI